MESIYQLEDFLKDLKELIIDGNEYEYKYEIALHKAIDKQKINFCKTLINIGLIKNINYTSGYDGDTPLIAIARNHDDISVVKLLIDKGADINLVNKNNTTALLIASSRNKTEIVKLLIENGADVNAVNIYNHTALQRAVYHSYKEIIKLLVDNGADINFVNNAGKKIIDYTIDEEIKKILTKKTHYKYIDASGKEYPKLKDAIRMICCVSMDVNTIETETGIIEPDEFMVKIWDDNKWICQKMNLGGTRIELPKAHSNIKVEYHVMTEGTNEKFIKIPGDVNVKIINEIMEIGSIYSD